MNLRCAVLLLAACCCAPLRAQEIIALAAEEITRLGIVFAAVEEGGQAGAAFPAAVVPSPDAMSSASALYPGVLEAWLAAPGESVAAGAPLARIRSPEVLDLQTARLAARTRVELARFEVEKDERLHAQGLIAEQRLRQTQRDLVVAEIDAKAAEQALARIGATEDADGLYLLRAPAAGVLAHREVGAGTPVERGTPLALLQGEGNAWVSARIPARLALPLRVGDRLGIGADGAGATLRQMDRAVDPATQTVEILAELDAGGDFLPGQILTLRLPAPAQGVRVPPAAVVHNGDETAVYVRHSRGVEVRVLDLVPAGSVYLAPTGLRAGEQVAVQGSALLKGIQLGLGGE